MATTNFTNYLPNSGDVLYALDIKEIQNSINNIESAIDISPGTSNANIPASNLASGIDGAKIDSSSSISISDMTVSNNTTLNGIVDLDNGYVSIHNPIDSNHEVIRIGKINSSNRGLLVKDNSDSTTLSISSDGRVNLSGVINALTGSSLNGVANLSGGSITGVISMGNISLDGSNGAIRLTGNASIEAGGATITPDGISFTSGILDIIGPTGQLFEVNDGVLTATHANVDLLSGSSIGGIDVGTTGIHQGGLGSSTTGFSLNSDGTVYIRDGEFAGEANLSSNSTIRGTLENVSDSSSKFSITDTGPRFVMPNLSMTEEGVLTATDVDLSGVFNIGAGSQFTGNTSAGNLIINNTGAYAGTNAIEVTGSGGVKVDELGSIDAYNSLGEKIISIGNGMTITYHDSSFIEDRLIVSEQGDIWLKAVINATGRFRGTVEATNGYLSGVSIDGAVNLNTGSIIANTTTIDNAGIHLSDGSTSAMTNLKIDSIGSIDASNANLSGSINMTNHSSLESTLSLQTGSLIDVLDGRIKAGNSTLTGDGIEFNEGSIDINSKFVVTSTGAMTARGVDVSGTFTINNGQIAGALTAGADVLINTDGINVVGNAGITVAGNDGVVVKDGTITIEDDTESVVMKMGLYDETSSKYGIAVGTPGSESVVIDNTGIDVLSDAGISVNGGSIQLGSSKQMILDQEGVKLSAGGDPSIDDYRITANSDGIIVRDALIPETTNYVGRMEIKSDGIYLVKFNTDTQTYETSTAAITYEGIYGEWLTDQSITSNKFDTTPPTETIEQSSISLDQDVYHNALGSFSSLIVTWEAATTDDVDGYKLYIKEGNETDSLFLPVAILDKEETKYTIRQVKPGVEYYVKISTFDKVGNESNPVQAPSSIIINDDQTIPAIGGTPKAHAGFKMIAVELPEVTTNKDGSNMTDFSHYLVSYYRCSIDDDPTISTNWVDISDILVTETNKFVHQLDNEDDYNYYYRYEYKAVDTSDNQSESWSTPSDYIQPKKIGKNDVYANEITANQLNIGSVVKSINPLQTVLFHFDGTLMSTQGLKPISNEVDGETTVEAVGSFAREGRFGAALALEEPTVNLLTEATGGNASLKDNNTGWEVGSAIHKNKDGVNGSQDGYFIVSDAADTKITDVSVTESLTYAMSIYAKSTEQTSSVKVDFYDSTGALIGDGVISESTTGEWDRYYGLITIPTGVSSVDIVISNGAPGTVAIDNVQLEEKTFSTSFINGTREQDGYVNYSDDILNPEEGTVSFWLNPNHHNKGDKAGRRLVSWGSDSGPHYYINLTDSNQIETIYSDGLNEVTIVSDNSIPENTWSHVVIAWDHLNQCVQTYINAQKTLEDADTGYNTSFNIPSFADGFFTIGGYSYNSNYTANCFFDEFRIDRVSRYEAEIISWHKQESSFYDASPQIDADSQNISAADASVTINNEGITIRDGKLEVTSHDGQTLITGGRLQIDGINVGIAQSENYLKNSFFTTISESDGYGDPYRASASGSVTRYGAKYWTAKRTSAPLDSWASALYFQELNYTQMIQASDGTIRATNIEEEAVPVGFKYAEKTDGSEITGGTLYEVHPTQKHNEYTGYSKIGVGGSSAESIFLEQEVVGLTNTTDLSTDTEWKHHTFSAFLSWDEINGKLVKAGSSGVSNPKAFIEVEELLRAPEIYFHNKPFSEMTDVQVSVDNSGNPVYGKTWVHDQNPSDGIPPNPDVRPVVTFMNVDVEGRTFEPTATTQSWYIKDSSETLIANSDPETWHDDKKYYETFQQGDAINIEVKLYATADVVARYMLGPEYGRIITLLDGEPMAIGDLSYPAKSRNHFFLEGFTAGYHTVTIINTGLPGMFTEYDRRALSQYLTKEEFDALPQSVRDGYINDPESLYWLPNPNNMPGANQDEFSLLDWMPAYMHEYGINPETGSPYPQLLPENNRVYYEGETSEWDALSITPYGANSTDTNGSPILPDGTEVRYKFRIGMEKDPSKSDSITQLFATINTVSLAGNSVPYIDLPTEQHALAVYSEDVVYDIGSGPVAMTRVYSDQELMNTTDSYLVYDHGGMIGHEGLKTNPRILLNPTTLQGMAAGGTLTGTETISISYTWDERSVVKVTGTQVELGKNKSYSRMSMGAGDVPAGILQGYNDKFPLETGVQPHQIAEFNEQYTDSYGIPTGLQSRHIANGSITSQKLAPTSVTEKAIADKNITFSKTRRVVRETPTPDPYTPTVKYYLDRCISYDVVSNDTLPDYLYHRENNAAYLRVDGTLTESNISSSEMIFYGGLLQEPGSDADYTIDYGGRFGQEQPLPLANYRANPADPLTTDPSKYVLGIVDTDTGTMVKQSNPIVEGSVVVYKNTVPLIETSDSTDPLGYQIDYNMGIITLNVPVNDPSTDVVLASWEEKASIEFTSANENTIRLRATYMY